MPRDLTQAQFDAECRRYGFERVGYLGYYRVPGERRVCVSVWNAGPRRRTQLAYLLKCLAKEERLAMLSPEPGA